MTGPFATRAEATASPEVQEIRRRFGEGSSEGLAAAKLAILTGACERTRAEIGRYDLRVLALIAGDTAEVCVSLAGVIERSGDLRALLAGARTEELRAALEADPAVRIALRTILRAMDGGQS